MKRVTPPGAARPTLVGTVLVVLLTGAGVGGAHGQSLEASVRGAEGQVAFSFETRPGVMVCDDGVVMQGRFRTNRDARWERNCVEGTARVLLQVRDGVVRDLDVEPPLGGVRGDLGDVGPEEATSFLLALARSGERVGDDAIAAAVLAEGPDLGVELITLAKDRSLRRDVRRAALFWTAQEAADVVADGIREIALEEDEDQDVRDAAVFALSQRPDEESVPLLMELARTAEQARTRRTAMFWLAQSEDPRVLAFFESVLLRRGG